MFSYPIVTCSAKEYVEFNTPQHGTLIKEKLSCVYPGGIRFKCGKQSQLFLLVFVSISHRLSR
jgi:hypothetical protein